MRARSTGTIEARQLRRSRSDRTLAGVCGGLAALVIVPVWGFLEFLDCWMSWLADC